MRDFVIMADAVSDIDVATQQEYGIVVIPSHIIKPDKTEMIAPLSWDEIGCDEFYAALKKDPNNYSTAPSSVGEMAAIYEKAIDEGKDIISISISQALSGTYGFMCQARDMVLEKHPDAKITVVDSRRFGFGYGIIAVHAAMKRQAGNSYEEVVDFIENNKNRFHQNGWLDDLQFVAKKGRMTHAKAFFGQLAGIQPIGEFDSNGMVTIIAKAKGAKAAMAACIEYMAETCEDPEHQTIFIAHSNRLKRAESYKAMIEERFGNKNVFIKDVYPADAINIGPGLMAAYYIGKPISEGLVEERAIMEKALAKK